MDLEVRLEALEAEVKVLKNEIQNVLLEIQEQVLLHYYPSLRADDEEPSDTVIYALEEVREERQKRQQSSPEAAETRDHGMGGNGDGSHRGDEVSAFGLERFGLGGAGSRLPKPAAGDAARPGLMAPPPAASAFPRAGAQNGEWETFSEMATWVQESISRIGAERTGHLIELYVEQGILSPRTADGLVGLIHLFV